MIKTRLNRFLASLKSLGFLAGMLGVWEGTAWEKAHACEMIPPQVSPCCYLHPQPETLKIPRCILVTEAIRPEIFPAFREQILQYDQENPFHPIIILVNSPGGCVRTALAMHDLMKLVKAPVVTIGMGMVASAGTLILSSGQKGDRYLLPHARLMIHQGQSMAFGDTMDIFDSNYNFLKYLRNLYNEVLSQNTGLSLDVLSYLKKHEHWMGAQEAVERGFADKVLTVNPFALTSREKESALRQKGNTP